MTKLYNINIQGERSKAMRKLMMGIDIGTQSIRVALVDTDGNIIAMRRHSHFIETPKPNWAVQDPASWWNILKKEIPALLAESEVNKEEIVSIGIDGHMHAAVSYTHLDVYKRQNLFIMISYHYVMINRMNGKINYEI